jgi:putative membrane protein
MKWLFYMVLALLVLTFGVGFVTKNAQVVSVNYYFGLDWEAPLALMLLTSLTIGVILGLAASIGMVLRMHHRLAQARREIRETEQEVKNLRSLPIRDVL